MHQVLIDPVSAPDDVRNIARQFMQIEGYVIHPNGQVAVQGRLLSDAQRIYKPLRARLETLGFTPFLRRTAAGVELIAHPGVIRHKPARLWINVVLFVLTVISVLVIGAVNEPKAFPTVKGFGDIPRAVLANPGALRAGLPFMLTILSILGTHEMGHFIVGRLRGAPMSWPYFIPMPFSITGTLGAVIVQREPLEDRRTLLEVGIAGPLAGLVVALPLLFWGLRDSAVNPVVAGSMQEGNSLLYLLAKFIVFGQRLPGNGVDVQLNSVAWGAWIGLLITMLNLLPIGQLDGGHVAYALLGRKAHYLAYAMIGVLVFLGVFVSPTWLFWSVLPLLTGLRHPAPFNDVPGLDRKHTALAIFGLIVFFLLLVPKPLS